MIIWQGFGFLAALIPFVLLVLLSLFDKSNTFTYGNEMVLAISAIAVWLVGKKLNSAKGKVLIDPETNKEVLLKNKHTLFWIPMEWYGLVLGALALFVLSKHFV